MVTLPIFNILLKNNQLSTFIDDNRRIQSTIWHNLPEITVDDTELSVEFPSQGKSASKVKKTTCLIKKSVRNSIYLILN